MQTMVPLYGFGGVPYSAVRKAAPRNLLDNSDFRNPVNQRGVSSGTVSDWAYFIDRWRGLDACTYELTDGGIVITGGGFCQSLAKGARDNGKTYTFAVCLSTGTIRTLTYTLPEINVSEWVNFNVKGYSDIQLEAGGDSFNYNVIIRYVSVATIRWAALYEGEYTAETLPEYQPKGYGAELAECQRYFWRMNNSNGWGIFALGWEQSSTNVRYIVMLPVQMRIRPSVAYAGKFCVTIGSIDTSEVTTMSIESFSGTYIQLNVVIPTQSIVKYRLSKLSGYNDSTAHIDFIADL